MRDVVIIGGGPAGCASAIALRQTFPSFRVLVVESTNYDRRRAGEVLPPMARPLLEHLGVLSQMSDDLGCPALGLAHAWGGTQLEDENYLFRVAGDGWHLERTRFDAMLAGRAETCGVTVWQSAALHSVERTNGLWRLQLSNGQAVTGRWVIDASGRGAAFARKQGARALAKDSLMSFARVFQHLEPTEARTVIESCTHGWWYTAPLPGRRRIVSLLTDSDIGRALHLTEGKAWHNELQSTMHIRDTLSGAEMLPTVLVRSATTTSLDCVYGEGWLAAGDAASAFDPLSAQGITSALRSGILAAFAVGDVLCHQSTCALERYAAILRTQKESFERKHHEHYSQEIRWSSQPFWLRRQSSASALSPNDLSVAGGAA